MAEPLFTEARYVIRAEFFGRGTHYWRFPKDSAHGWVKQRRLATRFVRADEERALADVPPADLPHVRVVRLKPKAAPPVEVSAAEDDDLPSLPHVASSRCGEVTTASARVPLHMAVKVGDRVRVDGHVLTVTEISSTSWQERIAQCSSHPKEHHGL